MTNLSNKLSASEIKTYVSLLATSFENAGIKYGIIQIRTANQAMKEAELQPIPKMLFDQFWHEGELCVLFADTGVGKSILAVQIAESIASGIPIKGFAFEAPAQLVAYLDLELSIKQFQRRYSCGFINNYIFSENFYRGELTTDEIPPGETFETYFNRCLEEFIIKTGAKIIIIDNLTRIRISDTDQAKDAKPLMEYLMKLKIKYGVSILALEHTRKRDESKPISLNDLQGSAMKARFFDSAFSIGRSANDPNMRYLIQKKERACERKFDCDNVVVCEISNPYNFTKFEFLEYGSERDHLRQPTPKETDQKFQDVLALKEQGLNNSEIARRKGVSEGAVRKWLKKQKNNDIT